MGMVDMFGVMARCMMDNGMKIKLMVMENMNGLMVELLLVNGRTTICMERACTHGKTDVGTTANT